MFPHIDASFVWLRIGLIEAWPCLWLPTLPTIGNFMRESIYEELPSRQRVLTSSAGNGGLELGSFLDSNHLDASARSRRVTWKEESGYIVGACKLEVGLKGSKMMGRRHLAEYTNPEIMAGTGF